MLVLQLLVAFLLLSGVGEVRAANDFARSPWVIDTSGPTPIDQGIYVASIRWINVGSPGDKLILTDTTGRKLFETTCPTGATEYESNLPFSLGKGIVINRLDSGLLYLYFE